jgi:hypothetical protein
MKDTPFRSPNMFEDDAGFSSESILSPCRRRRRLILNRNPVNNAFSYQSRNVDERNSAESLQSGTVNNVRLITTELLSGTDTVLTTNFFAIAIQFAQLGRSVR